MFGIYTCEPDLPYKDILDILEHANPQFWYKYVTVDRSQEKRVRRHEILPWTARLLGISDRDHITINRATYWQLRNKKNRRYELVTWLSYDLRRHSLKVLFKLKKDDADRKRDGRTKFQTKHELNGATRWGTQRTHFVLKKHLPS